MSELNTYENKVKERDYKFAYGGFFLRLIAYLIDILVIASIFQIVSAMVYIDPDLNFFGIPIRALVKLGITLLYFFLMTYITKGRTLGKFILGLRVISLTSDRLSLSQIFLREVCGRFVQDKIKIIYLFVGISPKKQSVFDMLLDTTVVKENIFKALYEK